MGFTESLAVDALRMFNNSKDEAVCIRVYNCYDNYWHICLRQCAALKLLYAKIIYCEIL